MRATLKQVLARTAGRRPSRGMTVLTYHRVGGGSPDERDVTTSAFAEQLDVLAAHDVLPLDAALDRLDAGDDRPSVVLTFDDGFADVHRNAWPLLRERRVPFTLYVVTGYLGGTMHWEGSTAKDTGAPALSWDQLAELADSGLCTLGNHTHDHVRPERLEPEQLDRCDEELRRRFGTRPAHFAYTWGIPVPAMERHLAQRFRSAVTGELGRNGPGTPRHRLRRVPVRGSDPVPFFAAKLRGQLLPERAYGAAVGLAKRAGARA